MLNITTLSYTLAGVSLGVFVYYILTEHKFKLPKFDNFLNTGHTPFLNQYTVDFTALSAQKKIDPVIARDDEIRRLTQILSRREKNNAVLVGEPGVGKTAIVEGLAVRIAEKTVPEVLLNKRVLALDVTGLISGTKYRGEFEERAQKIIQEITASNRTIILFVDEIHAILQTQGTEGAVSLADILKPFLARGDLQMIGATTSQEYAKYFKADASFERRFQEVEVREPTPKETLLILHGIKDKYREYHKVEFTDAALITAVEVSNKIIHDRKLPDKAIDAVDEAAAMVKVAHLRPSLTSILFQVALKAHPEAAALWGKIQDLDRKIITPEVKNKSHLVAQREAAEDLLKKIGVVPVDSSDIEKIIREWVK